MAIEWQIGDLLATDNLAEAARFFGAGWELGAPGKPGVRVHFPGTRTERLVEPDEVFARPASG